MHTKMVSDVDSIKQGQIIGVLYDKVLDFGIYLGYSSEMFDGIRKDTRYKTTEILYTDLDDMQSRIFNKHAASMYLLGTITLFTGSDTSDLTTRFFDDEDRKYIECKVSSVMSFPFRKEREKYFLLNRPVYVFDMPSVNIMHLLLKSSLVDSSLTGLSYFSSQTMKLMIRQHLQEVYDTLSKKYYYFNNLFSICTPIQSEDRVLGTVYACNKRLKNGDNNLVLMLYIGDDRFVQIGTGHEMIAEPASLLTSVQKSINNCNFLEKVLTEHRIVELPCGSTVYEIGLDNLCIETAQNMTFLLRKKIEKAQLTEVLYLL